MVKRIIAASIVVLGVVFSLVLIASYRERTNFNAHWQMDLRPRVQKVIDGLSDDGVDTTKAKLLCLKPVMTPVDGDACLTELEHEVNMPYNLH